MKGALPRRAAAILLVLAWGRAPAGAVVEPPPEADPAADYVALLRDTLPRGEVELAWTLSGSGRARSMARAREVRFRADSLDGELREGAGAGGAGEMHARRGAAGLTLGRLAPRWGAGLLLGTPAEPWRSAAEDRGARSAFRGRAGEGAHWQGHRGAVGVEGLGGRFSGRDLAAARLGWEGRGLAAGLQGLARRRAWQGGAVLAAGDALLEWAADARGRWRAEGLVAASHGPWRLEPRLRLGHPGFRSLAEPRRAGPARLVGLAAGRGLGAWLVSGGAAQWQWSRGRAGTRAGAELRGPLSPGAGVTLAWEERHGPQREGVASSPPRQTWSGELRVEADGVRLEIAHERGGEGPWGARGARALTALRAAGPGPWGAAWSVSHSVHGARPGEGLYVSEREPGRIVARAVSGRGARLLARLEAPAGGGRVELQVAVASAEGRPSRAEWRARWVKRGRLSAARPGAR